MGIQIDPRKAAERLAAAVALAQSAEETPERWRLLALEMQLSSSKTYTAALGTALLARATDDRVDALSIKADVASNSYSIRTLCHTVLVPAAAEYGFDLRATGREPLNNQPFFRYDHMSQIDRVHRSARPALDCLRAALKELNTLSRDEALRALAAFVRYRLEIAAVNHAAPRQNTGIGLGHLIYIVGLFLAEGVDRPRRIQALTAAAFDLVHTTVKTRRLNDPSRDLPGDVHAFMRERAVAAVEARGKPVPATEVRSFVSQIDDAGIGRGFLVVLDPGHEPLDRKNLVNWSWTAHHVALTIIESEEELLRAVFAWSQQPINGLAAVFPERMAARLREIEAMPISIVRWLELCASAVVEDVM